MGGGINCATLPDWQVRVENLRIFVVVSTLYILRKNSQSTLWQRVWRTGADLFARSEHGDADWLEYPAGTTVPHAMKAVRSDCGSRRLAPNRQTSPRHVALTAEGPTHLICIARSLPTQSGTVSIAESNVMRQTSLAILLLTAILRPPNLRSGRLEILGRPLMTMKPLPREPRQIKIFTSIE